MSFPPPWLDALDRDLFLWTNGGMHRWASKEVETVMRFTNEMGNGIVLAPVLALVVLLGRGGRALVRRVVQVLVGLGLSGWACGALKHAVGRLRPLGALPEAFERGDAFLAFGEKPYLFGLPSGHVATVAAIAAVVFGWAGALAEPWRRRTARALAVLTVLLVALARVYAGSHFPLDTLAGALLGAAAGALGLLAGRAVRLPPVPSPETA